MVSATRREAKRELEDLRSLINGLESAARRLEGVKPGEQAEGIAKKTEGWLRKAEKAYKSDNYERVISISNQIKKAAEKIQSRAEKQQKKRKYAGEVLKNAIREAFQKLREIDAEEAEDYAPRLVDYAEKKLRNMKNALDENEYKKLFKNSKELSQTGDQIKRKIQVNIEGDMKTEAEKIETKAAGDVKTEAEKIEMKTEGKKAPEISVKEGFFETAEIPTELKEKIEKAGKEAEKTHTPSEREKVREVEAREKLEKPEMIEEEHREPRTLTEAKEGKRLKELSEEETEISARREIPREIEPKTGEPESYLEVQREWNPIEGLQELRRKAKEHGVSVKEVKTPGIEPYHPLKDGPIAIFELPQGFEEIERYWVEEPFNFTVILRNEKTKEFRYHLVEPSLSDEEQKLLKKVKRSLRDVLPYEEFEEKEKEKILEEKFAEVAKSHNAEDPKTAQKLLYFIKRDNLGLNKVNPLLKDQYIEDVSCDGKNVPIYLYHQKYYNIGTNVKFGDELDSFVAQLAEKSGSHLSYGEPVAEASLPDGSRIQATFGKEVTTRGSSFSIRRFMGSTFTPVDLIKNKTFSPEMLAYLWMTAEEGKNAIIIGGTASGKTSTLNALGFFLPPDAKIVSIEDTRELSLYQENWLPNVTREEVGAESIDMHELVKIAMRQRPEVLIVGEVRGIEARAMFQAISTGHTAFTTMHAGSVQRAANRIEGDPMNISKSMFAGLDIVCLQKITNIGRERVRRNEKIVELTGLDPHTKDIRIAEIYEWEKARDTYHKKEESHLLREIQSSEGMSKTEMQKELKNREKVLNYLFDNSITSYGEIASTIRQYYYNPERVLEEIS